MTLPVNVTCPCGSRKSVAKCCALGQTVMCRPAKTAPPGGPTGLALPACYAGSLGDCERPLSREHFLSAALLREVEVGGPLRAAGFSWLADDEVRTLPVDALASKVLCKRHNSALNKLDTIGARWFRAVSGRIDLTKDRYPATEEGERVALFAGEDIERLLLKMLCGSATGGHFASMSSYRLEDQWLEILFGRTHMPFGWGLYLDGGVGAIHRAPGDVGVAAMYLGERLVGGSFSFGQLVFHLVLGP